MLTTRFQQINNAMRAKALSHINLKQVISRKQVTKNQIHCNILKTCKKSSWAHLIQLTLLMNLLTRIRKHKKKILKSKWNISNDWKKKKLR